MLGNVLTLSMAVGCAVDHIVSAMVVSLPQNFGSAQCTFHHLTAIDDVVRISGGVTYDDMVELNHPDVTYPGAQESALASRVGHQLPPFQANQGRHCVYEMYITRQDMSRQITQTAAAHPQQPSLGQADMSHQSTRPPGLRGGSNTAGREAL